MERIMCLAKRISTENTISFEDSVFLILETLKNTSLEDAERVYNNGGIHSLSLLYGVRYWDDNII